MSVDLFSALVVGALGDVSISPRILSGITLSGQRENKASVEFSLWLILEGGASSETGVDVVPPFQFIAFAELPAEQDNSALAQ